MYFQMIYSGAVFSTILVDFLAFVVRVHLIAVLSRIRFLLQNSVRLSWMELVVVIIDWLGDPLLAF